MSESSRFWSRPMRQQTSSLRSNNPKSICIRHSRPGADSHRQTSRFTESATKVPAPTRPAVPHEGGSGLLRVALPRWHLSRLRAANVEAEVFIWDDFHDRYLISLSKNAYALRDVLRPRSAPVAMAACIARRIASGGIAPWSRSHAQSSHPLDRRRDRPRAARARLADLRERARGPCRGRHPVRRRAARALRAGPASPGESALRLAPLRCPAEDPQGGRQRPIPGPNYRRASR